jgi:hypothetical protein
MVDVIFAVAWIALVFYVVRSRFELNAPEYGELPAGDVGIGTLVEMPGSRRLVRVIGATETGVGQEYRRLDTTGGRITLHANDEVRICTLPDRPWWVPMKRATT